MQKMAVGQMVFYVLYGRRLYGTRLFFTKSTVKQY
jgi:hypothetical protein